MGAGMGLSMGTPLNYLMQINVRKEEAASAQSTLSLIKSIGIAVSPNILINFIAEAGNKMPSNLMAVMPPIQEGVSNASQSMSVSGVPQNILNSFQNADVTSIIGTMKEFASFMFDKAKPGIEQGLVSKLPPHANVDAVFNSMKAGYLDKVDSARVAIENTFQQTMNNGFAHLFIASAIIAAVGLIFTLLLTNKKNN